MNKLGVVLICFIARVLYVYFLAGARRFIIGRLTHCPHIARWTSKLAGFKFKTLCILIAFGR